MAGVEQRERFQDMYVAYHALVLAYCVRRIGHDEAGDAAAEVFTVAWRRLRDVPAGEGTLPWLYGVAARTVGNRHRSRRRRSRLRQRVYGLGHSSPPSPETQVVRRSEDQAVVEAIRRLRPGDREVLLLSAWEGLSSSQIALRFDISPKAAEKRLTRAKARLATELTSTENATAATTPPIMQEGGSP